MLNPFCSSSYSDKFNYQRTPPPPPPPTPTPTPTLIVNKEYFSQISTYLCVGFAVVMLLANGDLCEWSTHILLGSFTDTGRIMLQVIWRIWISFATPTQKALTAFNILAVYCTLRFMTKSPDLAVGANMGFLFFDAWLCRYDRSPEFTSRRPRVGLNMP